MLWAFFKGDDNMPTDERIVDAIKKAYFIKGLNWNNDIFNEVIPVKYINNIIGVLEDIYYQQTKAESDKSIPYNEPKTGHWIEGKSKDTCDKCRCTYPKNIGFKNYCPNCGIRMIEPQESEDKE